MDDLLDIIPWIVIIVIAVVIGLGVASDSSEENKPQIKENCYILNDKKVCT